MNTLDLLKRTLRLYEPIDFPPMDHPKLHNYDKIADNLKKRNPKHKKIPKDAIKVKREVQRLL